MQAATANSVSVCQLNQIYMYRPYCGSSELRIWQIFFWNSHISDRCLSRFTILPPRRHGV